jgi:hypothetical protein
VSAAWETAETSSTSRGGLAMMRFTWPALTACMTTSDSVWPVQRIRADPGLLSIDISRKATPFTSGMTKSAMTTSGRSRSTAASASRGLVWQVVSNPALRSISDMNSRISASSSTMRTLGIGGPPVLIFHHRQDPTTGRRPRYKTGVAGRWTFPPGTRFHPGGGRDAR